MSALHVVLALVAAAAMGVGIYLVRRDSQPVSVRRSGRRQPTSGDSDRPVEPEA